MDAVKSGNKSRALIALRRRKYQEGLLQKTDGQLEVLENLVSLYDWVADGTTDPLNNLTLVRTALLASTSGVLDRVRLGRKGRHVRLETRERGPEADPRRDGH